MITSLNEREILPDIMEAEIVEIVEETSSPSQPSLNLTYRCKFGAYQDLENHPIASFIFSTIFLSGLTLDLRLVSSKFTVDALGWK